MTNREFFVAVINANLSDELSEHARKQLELLDRRNSARKQSPKALEKQAQDSEIREKILAILSDSPLATSEIAKEIEVSNSKASAELIKLVNDGKISVKDFKVGGKGRTVKGYYLAESE